MEEKKESRSIYDEVITKNPMFYLQEGIKAILKCLGFESPKLVHQASSPSSSSSSSSSMSDTNKREEESEKQEQECVLFHEDGNKQGSDSTNDNYKNEPPVENEDPPQSETLILATERRGRPPSRPKVGSGPPPQNN
ncbi:hypothetical protein AABB24_028553 [Solanum stoloniferum]|uniref:Uncharacterized protein n=1 Tax=Solanum stoloniferum TaxID=62892 RepID=A0ABD2S707_9SOLN